MIAKNVKHIYRKNPPYCTGPDDVWHCDIGNMHYCYTQGHWEDKYWNIIKDPVILDVLEQIKKNEEA